MYFQNSRYSVICRCAPAYIRASGAYLGQNLNKPRARENHIRETCRENSSQEHLRHRYTPFPWTIVGLVHQNALQASPTHRCQICRRKVFALPAHNRIILIYLKLMMRFPRWRNKTIFIFVWTNLVSDQYMYEICKGNLHCTRYTNINNDYRY